MFASSPYRVRHWTLPRETAANDTEYGFACRVSRRSLSLWESLVRPQRKRRRPYRPRAKACPLELDQHSMFHLRSPFPVHSHHRSIDRIVVHSGLPRELRPRLSPRLKGVSMAMAKMMVRDVYHPCPPRRGHQSRRCRRAAWALAHAPLTLIPVMLVVGLSVSGHHQRFAPFFSPPASKFRPAPSSLSLFYCLGRGHCTSCFLGVPVPRAPSWATPAPCVVGGGR